LSLNPKLYTLNIAFGCTSLTVCPPHPFNPRQRGRERERENERKRERERASEKREEKGGLSSLP